MYVVDIQNQSDFILCFNFTCQEFILSRAQLLVAWHLGALVFIFFGALSDGVYIMSRRLEVLHLSEGIYAYYITRMWWVSLA
jgi:hypothetical protein